MSRKRGRPAHTDDGGPISKQNDVIGRTAHRLAQLGYPRRKGVFEVIARLFPSTLGLAIPSERAKVSAHRVEEIYEAWLSRQPSRHARLEYTRESLRRIRCPPGDTLTSLAVALLLNDGYETDRLFEHLLWGNRKDFTLTRAARAAYRAWGGDFGEKLGSVNFPVVTVKSSSPKKN